MKVKVLWPGKTRNRNLKDLETDYLKRIARLNPIECVVFRESRESSGERKKALEADGFLARISTGDEVILLSEEGSQMTSRELAVFIDKRLTYSSRDIVFLVGGEDGFGEKILEKGYNCLSLSRMTLTHEWARVMLLEQIYRAFTIIRNIRYQR